MIYRITYTILFCSLFTGIEAQDVNALVDKVKGKLSLVNDYQARGVMKLDVSFMKVPPSAITIYYTKPDQFVIKQDAGISIAPKGGINANLNALFADGKYAAVAAGRSTIAGKMVSIVKLLPLDEGSNVIISTLYIDEAALLIYKANITTRDNGSYVLEMAYGKYSQWGLPDRVIFSFNIKDYKLPKGLAFDYDTGEKPAPAAAGKDQQGKVEIMYSEYLINKGLGASSSKQSRQPS